MTDALIQAHAIIRDTLDPALTRAWHAGRASSNEAARAVRLQTSSRARWVTFAVQIIAAKRTAGDITITQVSAKGVDGGVTLHLAAEKRH
jgi:hypothetical protein